MILPNEVTKKIEECCVKIDNLEKALEYAIEDIKVCYSHLNGKGYSGWDGDDLKLILNRINKIKEGKEYEL